VPDNILRNKPVTVVIAEDQVMMAEGLTAILEKSGMFKVLGLSPNGEHLMHLLNNQQPELILLDLNMPVLDGFEACKLIRKRYPKIIVVALTMYNNPKVFQQAREAGAAGMLLKYTSSLELVQKLSEILENAGSNVFASTENAGTGDVEQAVPADDAFLLQFKITKRETEIIKLIAQGLQTHEIAGKLFLSTHTVNTHRKNILNKLGLNNAVELVNFARENRLL
jgi:DNA-binding NarL/FixJ family response regulator